MGIIFSLNFIRNYFYYENQLRRFVTLKLYLKCELLFKVFGNDFKYKNSLEMIFLQKCIANNFH